ncbi:MAG: hypothetical protein K2W96_28825 [Gemmataceae bacterium]|nr:hypothetical protein [Gemmataceae bacterium]
MCVIVQPSTPAFYQTREKKLTNMRASGSEKTVPLKPPRVFSLGDELAEITPTAVRLRKIMLKENDRKRAERALKGGMGPRVDAPPPAR